VVPHSVYCDRNSKVFLLLTPQTAVSWRSTWCTPLSVTAEFSNLDADGAVECHFSVQDISLPLPSNARVISSAIWSGGVRLFQLISHTDLSRGANGSYGTAACKVLRAGSPTSQTTRSIQYWPTWYRMKDNEMGGTRVWGWTTAISWLRTASAGRHRNEP
jgi:hypothetical protein